MIKKVLNTISSNKLLNKEDVVLITVSGGLDSVSLLHLLHSEGYQCMVAHVNFNLRGSDSEKDEQFVASLAKAYNLPFFSTSVNTKAYAQKHKLSIEMAARDIRYAWFQELADQNAIPAIAVAHHLDDQVETFFINLVRGSGTKGLSAMQYKNGNIVRPFLNVTRQEILTYAETHKLQWREDKSNQENIYRRNQFRNIILPALQEQNPSINDTINRTIHKMREGNQIISRYVSLWSDLYLKEHEGKLYIPILPLQSSEGPQTLLFELLSPFGFNEAQISNILDQMQANPGKMFYSSNKRLLIDRQELIVSDFAHEEKHYLIKDDLNTEHLPIKLELEIAPYCATEHIPTKQEEVWMDADKVSFPLSLRPWEQGDKFVPFGMHGTKKLSDFFIDQKVSIIEKEQAWVLTCSNHIIWIVSHRLDNRVKIDAKTTRVLKIHLKK